MDYYLHDDPRMDPAWGPWFSHEYINYFSCLPNSWLMGLPRIPVRPNPGFRDRPEGPDHLDQYKEVPRQVRSLDPMAVFEPEERNGEYPSRQPEGAAIEPWKILVLYAAEPDLQLDCGLDLHPTQVLTGGSHGLRHMQFRIKEGLEIGCAVESFDYYKTAARRALDHGNLYWAWRFLARASHYLADLGHPFHVNVIPRDMDVDRISSPETVFCQLSAVHTGFEVHTQVRFRQGFLPFKEALMRGARDGIEARQSLGEVLQPYIERNGRRMDPIRDCLHEHFGPELYRIFDQVGQSTEVDVSKQTTSRSRRAAGVLFQDPAHPGLAALDRMTEPILYDVGFMLGRLVAEFEAYLARG